MRTRRPRPAPVPRSAFAGFRFPPEVIVIAVRWYLRYALSDAMSNSSWSNAASRSITSRSTGGAAVHAAAGRRRSALPPRRRRPLTSRRDLREGRQPVALRVPRDRPVRPGGRRVRRPSARRRGGPSVLSAGHRHDQGATRWGDHGPGGDLPGRAGGAAASGMAPHRPVRQQPHRVRPRPAEGAAATDARPQAGPQRQGDHRRGRRWCRTFGAAITSWRSRRR